MPLTFVSQGPLLIPSSYAGPGDVGMQAQFAWYGLSAFSAAKAAAGVNAIQIVDSGGSNALDIPVQTDGTLKTSVLSGWGGTGSMYIKTWYEGSGSGNPNLTQSTVANMAKLNLSSIGGSRGPEAVFSAGVYYDGPNYGPSEPWTLTTFAHEIGLTSGGQIQGISGQFYSAWDGGGVETWGNNIAGNRTGGNKTNRWHYSSQLVNSGSSGIKGDAVVDYPFSQGASTTGNPLRIGWDVNGMNMFLKEFSFSNGGQRNAFDVHDAVLLNRKLFWGNFPETQTTAFDPAKTGSSLILSNDNWQVRSQGLTSVNWNQALSTTGKTSGKVYWEIHIRLLAVLFDKVCWGATINDGNQNTFMTGALHWVIRNEFGSSVGNGDVGASVTYNVGNEPAGDNFLGLADVLCFAADFDSGKAWYGYWHSGAGVTAPIWGPSNPATGNNPVFTWSPSGTWFAATQMIDNGDNSGHLRTAATSCRFAPPTGFSYWDT